MDYSHSYKHLLAPILILFKLSFVFVRIDRKFYSTVIVVPSESLKQNVNTFAYYSFQRQFHRTLEEGGIDKKQMFHYAQVKCFPLVQNFHLKEPIVFIRFL